MFVVASAVWHQPLLEVQIQLKTRAGWCSCCEVSKRLPPCLPCNIRLVNAAAASAVNWYVLCSDANRSFMKGRVACALLHWSNEMHVGDAPHCRGEGFGSRLAYCI